MPSLPAHMAGEVVKSSLSAVPSSLVSKRAMEKGANAVVGIDLDYEVLGENNGMLMVTASGTAVTVA